MQSAVLSITQVHGGTAFNVIPDEVKLAGTVRFFDKAVQALIEKRMQDMAALVAQAHGCTAEVRYRRLYPATVNSVAETALCQRVLLDLVGEGSIDIDPQPLMASEDFAFMLEAKPGCYIWAGNGAGEGGCAIHNPHYDFNDRLIPFGAAYWVRLAQTALPQ
jgi:hippurate hydrolase